MNIFWYKRVNIFLAVICSVCYSELQSQTLKFNHDYSQTLVMKLGISRPDGLGGSNVINDFEDALEIIKKTDDMTFGVPKIIYLVGWQYNGHDDKYPAWFEVNKALKREGDNSAEESLRWLMQESKKYNTTVSFHINMTDAYDNSPLWDTYLKNDLISKKKNGKLKVIGNYNDRKAYQVNYKNEWESDYAQKRIDALLEMLPVQDAGTIHIDAWFARSSPGHKESEETEREYQKLIAQYWIDKGVDVTSEFIIDYMTRLVPYAWWFNQSQEKYLSIAASAYCGGKINSNLKGDKKLGLLFGTSIHGEGIFPALNTEKLKPGWEQKFVHDFCMNSVPYFYLNQFDRLSVEGKGNKRIAKFSDDVETHLADSSIWQDGNILKKGGDLLLPVSWKNDCFIAFSEDGYEQKRWALPREWEEVKSVKISSIHNSENQQTTNLNVVDNHLILSLRKGEAVFISPYK